MVILHPNTIAEYGAPGERTAWVDCENGDTPVLPSQRTYQLVDERALAGPGRAGDPDGACFSAMPGKLFEERLVPVRAIFDQRCGSSDRANIAGEDAIDYRDAVSSFSTVEYLRAT
jgi:hypothetical protein